MSTSISKTRRGRPPKNEANRTRELILDAAEEIIEQQEPGSLRLQQIAGMVGIQVPTIYGHFKDGRDGVLNAVGERYIAGLSLQFQFKPEEDPNTALLRETRRLVLHLASNPAHIKMSLIDLCSSGGTALLNIAAGGDSVDALTSGPLSAMYKRLDDILDAGKQTDTFRQNVDAVRFLRSVMGAALVSLTWPTHSTLGRNNANVAKVEQIVQEIEDLANRLVTTEQTTASN